MKKFFLCEFTKVWHPNTVQARYDETERIFGDAVQDCIETEAAFIVNLEEFEDDDKYIEALAEAAEALYSNLMKHGCYDFGDFTVYKIDGESYPEKLY